LLWRLVASALRARAGSGKPSQQLRRDPGLGRDRSCPV